MNSIHQRTRQRSETVATPYQAQAQGQRAPNDSLFAPLVVADDRASWLAWMKAKNDWLHDIHLRTGRNHTVRCYHTAYSQLFTWARFTFGHHLPPWDVTAAIARAWRDWMYQEGKVLERDVATDGNAPWEIGDPGLLPDWTSWKDTAGRLVAREVYRSLNTIEIRINARGPLSDASVNLKLAALASFYKHVRGHPTILLPDGQTVTIWSADRANPFDPETIERVSVDLFGRSVEPSLTELRAILGAIDRATLAGKRDFSLLYTYAYTCRRFSELIELKWGDIQPGADGNYVYTFTPRKKKIKNPRVKLILDRNCYHAIHDYLTAAGRLETIRPDDYIFIPLRSGDRPLSNQRANAILKKYARLAGVPETKAHIHALRHAGLCWRMQLQEQTKGDVDIREIMIIAQHGNFDTTRIYVDKMRSPRDTTGRAAADGLMPQTLTQGRLL